MKQFTFHNKLIVRSPSKSIDEYSSAAFDQLMSDLELMKALKYANPAFFNLLQKKKSLSEKLTDQEWVTLTKYLNRMCFRPTPFGLFSSFSLIEWKHEGPSITFSKEHDIAHILPDQMIVQNMNNLFNADNDQSQLFYQSNSSCYVAHQEIRYLQTEINKESADYQLQSVPANYINRKILKFCSSGKPFGEIVRMIGNEASCDYEEAKYYCEFLIGNGMLVPRFFLNISGPPFVNRLARNTKQAELHALFSTVNDELKSSDPDRADRVLKQLFGENGEMKDNEKPFLYINLERKVKPGAGLPDEIQGSILDALDCLNRLTYPEPSSELKRFIRLFRERYDLQQVPLLEVLDPEIGIGYTNAGTDSSLPLLKDLTFKDHQENQKSSWSDVHALLLRLWNKGKHSEDGTPLIVIGEDDLNSIPQKMTDISLPPSFAVIFRIAGEKVFIESAGGATATQLAGRFTLFNPGLLAAMREIVSREESLNPGVVFAEIVHLSGAHTDNINLREHLYNFEIPLSARSVYPFEKQILLNDILVTVRSSQVILWSKRLNKRIIPRLSSAYNYRLNDLPVFQFLCDVQSQGLKTRLSVDLSSLFPGLDFYPRVMYKKSILYPATWRIKHAMMSDILHAPAENQLKLFKKLADNIGLTGFFSLNRGDRYQVFDRRSDDDLRFFLKSASFNEDMMLKEFFVPVGDYDTVKDEQNRQYIPQFIAFLVNEARVYSESPVSHAYAGKKQRTFLPGSEWLYMKIYCQPTVANFLLTHVLIPFVNNRQHLIDKWFFIRYNDPHPHLRLRLRLFEEEETGKMIKMISVRLQKEVRSGIVSFFVVDIYQRELERYGRAIDKVESVFYHGSLLACHFLKTIERNAGTGEHSVIFISLLSLFSAISLDPERLARFFKNYYSGLFTEFNGDKVLKVQLDQKYRTLRSEFERWESGEEEAIPFPGRKYQRNFNKAVLTLLRSLPAQERKKYLSDIVHMQINRILTEEHRKQELVISYCLFKYYLSVSRRNSVCVC